MQGVRNRVDVHKRWFWDGTTNDYFLSTVESKPRLQWQDRNGKWHDVATVRLTVNEPGPKPVTPPHTS
jgi:hypothetical protein